MKPKLVLAFLVMFVTQTSFNQTIGTYSPKSDCSNLNTFRASGSTGTLGNYTVKIYPNGTLRLDMSKVQELGGIESLYPMLGVDNGSTFQLVKVTASRFNSGKQYKKYQQYHNGVKVEGGGYTLAAFIPDGPPDDPCDQAYMLSPDISSNINVSTTPTIKQKDLGGIITSESNLSSELVIVHNLLNDCGYHLAWKVDYSNQGGKTSWVNAQTGTILKTIDLKQDLLAPMATAAYGTPNISNQMNGNTASLISVDGRVRTHNFGAACPANPAVPAQWTVGLIPTTTATQWTNEAPAVVYQAHHVVSSVLPVFDGVDIDFGTVNVASCNGFGATSLFGSTTAIAYIEFAVIDGSTTALFDVAAHELEHTFLNDFLDYTNAGNQSLHEGIADMIGTYAESIIQGTDWIMGDDEPNVAAVVGRDLQNPGNNFDCFDEVSGLGSPGRHNRSKPLGHWFFLVSQQLGMNQTMRIVLESLNLMGVDDDYEDMREAVMAFVEDEYGPCSGQFATIWNAWNAICVGPDNFETNYFYVSGNSQVCEEDDHMHLWIENPTQGAQYRWYFPIEWTIQGTPGNPSGNLYVGNHFVVTNFPDYDWYPRYFTLKVTSPALGSEYTRFKVVKLIDCDGDDPTCQEYYEFNGGGESEERELSLDQTQGESILPEVRILKVHDLVGRLLYEGIPSSFDRTSLNTGMVVLSYFDEKGKLLKSEKLISIK